jgi:hypothetical protein
VAESAASSALETAAIQDSQIYTRAPKSDGPPPRPGAGTRYSGLADGSGERSVGPAR